MKISWKGFAGKNHSWAIVSQNTCRELIKRGHEVHIFSTNGIEHFPKDLENNLVGYCDDKGTVLYGRDLDSEYDMQLSYTAMKNFQNYLSKGTKNRFGMWCYEFAGKNSLPLGFAKCYLNVDKLLTPSKFAKEVFLQNKIPESAIEVIPHGFDASNYLDNSRPKYPLKTNKRFKILANIAQPHIRKNLDGLLDAYGKAFTNKDDVCLVLKIVDKPVEQPFEVSFKDIYNRFRNKYKNHGETIIINIFIDEIDTLYRSIDCLFTMTHSECFFLPGLEGLSSNNIVIASGWGGQLDFLNNDNSLLVSGKEIMAPPEALYWQNKPGTFYFKPDVDDAVEKLRLAYNNTDSLKDKFSQNSQNILKEYTWEKSVDKIMNLVK